MTYPWRSSHNSVREEVEVQANLTEDILKQANNLQGQHILKGETEHKLLVIQLSDSNVTNGKLSGTIEGSRLTG